MSIPSEDVTVTGIEYDTETGEVVLNFDYSTSINEQDLSVEINTSSNPYIVSSASFNFSIKAVASNNGALVYYEDSDYTLANIAKYLALVAAISAILLMIVGSFGGRLIAL